MKKSPRQRLRVILGILDEIEGMVFAAREQINTTLSTPTGECDIADVARAACQAAGVGLADLIHGGRRHELVLPRHLAMLTCVRMAPHCTTRQIATYFRQGRSNVIRSIARAADRVRLEPRAAKIQSQMRSILERKHE